MYKILSKTGVKARTSELWCYKKVLVLSTHRKKKSIKEIECAIFMTLIVPMHLTYIFPLLLLLDLLSRKQRKFSVELSACVLQDFETLTPHMLEQLRL